MRTGNDETTLGVVLDAKGIPAQVTVGRMRLAVIGYVWEPDGDLVAIDDAGAVWACPPGGGSRTLMNSSVDALRRFLDLFGQFFDADAAGDTAIAETGKAATGEAAAGKAADASAAGAGAGAKAADAPPMHLSAAQLAEKLEALRRGEIRPARPRPPGNRRARVRQLKADLKSVDSAGLAAGWWSVILEQVDDGIL